MIIIYVLEHCPYCNNALKLLEYNNIKYKKIIVENTEEAKKHYKKQSGMNTFPQIFLKINKDNILKIGGYTDLVSVIDESKNIKKSNISIESIYYMYNLLYKK
jgi:glutaredoxin 3